MSRGVVRIPWLSSFLTLNGRASKTHVTSYNLGGSISIIYSTADGFSNTLRRLKQNAIKRHLQVLVKSSSWKAP